VIDNTTAIGANSKAFDIVFPGLTNVPRHALLTPHIGSGISSLTTASASALAAQLKQFLSLWPPSNYYTNGQFSIYNTSSGTTGGSGLGTTVMFDYQVDY
jgi:hypothetical protein